MYLEVVSNLSTAAFLGALKRFIARRGSPKKIYSDNATNFIGAKNSLNDVYKLFKEKYHIKQIDEFCSQNEIKLQTIPPRSPHVGGLWEAGVKVVKKHFKSIEDYNFTFQQLSTIMAEIEAIMNSRPLTSLSDDPNDLQVLTPSHFLIGTYQSILIDSKNNTTYKNYKDGWRDVQKFSNEMWERWSQEYLG